ncbi:MAG: hypothetical protein WDO73_01490 [Ignavibacteriota bacterium]
MDKQTKPSHCDLEAAAVVMDPLTLSNLQLAYGAETCEHRRYLAFANRAEKTDMLQSHRY